ncbi:uncharacterized protein LOC110708891 [Chenopodium quinoa]|uniref:uncharacterized protein LOC110708891 n=1 Tax=Chenopodium quinoa TaxID=63459 RepID=UPI000B777D4B|nr:uncharacterized protein LOC110708891 [Chenopodium quinoa]
MSSSLAASKGWELHQLDINNAFLHGNLIEEVYMQVPEGIPNPNGLVRKLKKSLYGLKQASRQWYARLNFELLSLGFTQSLNDYSLFLKKSDSHIIIVAVYVDDIILTGNDTAGILDLKAHLHQVFSIKDLGKLNFFLGIEVCHISQGIILTQRKFTKELLQECDFDVSKTAKTPLPASVKLFADYGDFFPDLVQYRCLVGKLNFLTHTRPDISYAVQTLSQFLQQPRMPHLHALQHVMRYIAGTIGQGILLLANEQLKLQAYSDSDWAACPNSRRSVIGYIMLLGNSPISWKSKKQGTTSKSSSEAEYRAMEAASSEICWLVRLLQELGGLNLLHVELNCDNQAAIHIAKNPVFHGRTKHIEIDCHFTREKVLAGMIQLSHVPSHEQLADLFTKILPIQQHAELCSKLGLIDSQSPTSLKGGITDI